MPYFYFKRFFYYLLCISLLLIIYEIIHYCSKICCKFFYLFFDDDDEINTFIQQGYIPFIMLQKICISNECCSFELSIHPEKPEESVTVSTKTLNSTTALNFDNKKCFLSSKSAF